MMNLLLNKIDWSSSLEELSAEEAINTFLELLEFNVSLLFPKKEEYLDKENPSFGNPQYKSNNKVPRKVRNKSTLSKTILSTKSPQKHLFLTNKLEIIEKELRESYEERRNKKERKAIERI